VISCRENKIQFYYFTQEQADQSDSTNWMITQTNPPLNLKIFLQVLASLLRRPLTGVVNQIKLKPTPPLVTARLIPRARSGHNNEGAIQLTRVIEILHSRGKSTITWEITQTGLGHVTQSRATHMTNFIDACDIF